MRSLARQQTQTLDDTHGRYTKNDGHGRDSLLIPCAHVSIVGHEHVEIVVRVFETLTAILKPNLNVFQSSLGSAFLWHAVVSMNPYFECGPHEEKNSP